MVFPLSVKNNTGNTLKKVRVRFRYSDTYGSGMNNTEWINNIAQGDTVTFSSCTVASEFQSGCTIHDIIMFQAGTGFYYIENLKRENGVYVLAWFFKKKLIPSSL